MTPSSAALDMLAAMMTGALIYTVPSDDDGILAKSIGLRSRFGRAATRCSVGRTRDHRAKGGNGEPGALHVKCAAADALELLLSKAGLTLRALVYA